MDGRWRCLAISLLLSALTLQASAGAALPRAKTKLPAVRWEEGRAGCTLTRRDDGRYYYGLTDKDLVLTVAIDSQELQLVRHRHVPFFAALLTLRYKGQAPLDVNVENISLEFVKHFQVVLTALDPDELSQQVQNDADELDHQTAREVAKHPEQKATKEMYMRAFLKDSADLQEFLGRSSLRPARLSPDHPEANGWVFFSTNSKWISDWKKPEELILRVPFEDKVYEFPFMLPPKAAEVILRKRQ